MIKSKANAILFPKRKTLRYDSIEDGPYLNYILLKRNHLDRITYNSRSTFR
jgi:hypothetical protein